MAMAATEDILARVVSGSEAAELGESDLAALRALLVGPERAAIRKLLQRLDDPATRAAEIAKVLPEAIALRNAEGDGLSGTLVPVVRESMAGALKENPELLARAARKALREMMLTPWRWLGGMFRKKQGERAAIEQVYLIELATGEILEQQIRPLESKDEDVVEEARNVASMVTYLLALLRQREQLAHYAELGQLRIGQHTYGVSAGASLVLLSVMRGEIGVELEMDRCREVLMGVDREYFDGHGRREGGEWLPRLAVCQNG